MKHMNPAGIFVLHVQGGMVTFKGPAKEYSLFLAIHGGTKHVTEPHLSAALIPVQQL
jgi:hypothetical protein